MRRGLGLCAAIAIAGGCQDLPDINDNVCGNLVLEPGEDCDGFGDGESTACGSPGTVNGCFFTCDTGDLAGSPCPDGFGCGADGRCRAPSDRFVEGAQVAFPVTDFKVADIDGDGTEDLIGSSQNAFHIAFGDGDGRLTTRTFPNSALGGFFAVGNLNGDNRADVVASDGTGITAFLGRADQTIEPVPFAIFQVNQATQVKITSVSGTFGLLDPTDDIRQFQFFDDPSGGRFIEEDDAGAVSLDALLGAGFVVDAVETPLSVADIDNDGNQEMAITHIGATQVWLLNFDNGANTNAPPSLVGGAPLALPAGFRASGRALLADVNNDGRLDVSVGMDNGAGVVALGRSLRAIDGTYPAVTKVPIFGAANGEVEAPGLRLLDVGQLDGDGRADYILSNGIFRDVVVGVEALVPVVGSNIFAGRFVDLNKDGRMDAVTVPGANQGVEVYLQSDGAELAFNRTSIGTSNHFAGNGELVVGDFDGDLVNDVALTATNLVGDSTLEVLFGSLDNRFQAPVRMARFDGIIQVFPARFLSALDFTDGIDDLIVTSFQNGLDADGEPQRTKIVSALRGDSSRAMSVPLVLIEGEGADQIFYVPAQTAIGTIDGNPAIFAATAAFNPNTPDANNPDCALKHSGCGFAFALPVVNGQVTVDGTPDADLGIQFDRLPCYGFEAVDLTADGTDELLGVFLAERCARAADPEVVRFDVASGTSVTIDPEIPADAGLRRFITGDLDNDGVAEIISAYGIFAGDGPNASEGGVVVLWNEPSAFRVEQVLASRVAPLAVAKGRLNADNFEDLVMLGIDVDEQGDPQVYASAYNGAAYDPPEFRGELGFGTAIGIADLNRDGLGDLVIGDGSVARVFLAEPAEPRGSQEPAAQEPGGETGEGD